MLLFLLLLCVLMLPCCAQEPAVQPVEPPSTEADEKVIRKAAKDAVAEIEAETELEEHLLSRFECELGKVVVTGDHATLEAHVSNVDLPAALKEAFDEVSMDAETIDSVGELYREGTDEELTDAFVDVLYQHLDDCTDLVETDVTLRFTKRDNEWKLDEGSAEEFATAAYAGLEK